MGFNDDAKAESEKELARAKGQKSPKQHAKEGALRAVNDLCRRLGATAENLEVTSASVAGKDDTNEDYYAVGLTWTIEGYTYTAVYSEDILGLRVVYIHIKDHKIKVSPTLDGGQAPERIKAAIGYYLNLYA